MTGRKIEPLVRYKVDFVIPCYNPVLGWEVKFSSDFNEVVRALPHCEIHLILIDDGSSQNFSETQEAYLKKNITHFTLVKSESNWGKGRAVRRGIALSRSPFAIYTDSDLPYNSESIARVIQGLIDGADLVFGARSKKYYENLPFQRKFISKALQIFNRFILRLPVTDTQCGLKGLNRVGKNYLVQTTSNSYLFDLELMMSAYKKPGLKIQTALAETSPDFHIVNMRFKTLLREFLTLIKILLKR